MTSEADNVNTASASEPIWDVHKDTDVMVPMRDGVRLATDVYRPALDGRPIEEPVPALLVRTSYDKTASEWDDVWPYYASRGYAFVIQDLRSRFRSEGDGKYYHTVNPWEGHDGYDTVEWVAAQDWCNGKVGTLGSSHRAITQTLLALERPPHLAAMWVEAGPTNIYAHEAREGGAMSIQMFAALHLHALDCHEIGYDPDKTKTILEAMHDMRSWVHRFPIKRGETALRVAPSLEQTALDYYYRGTYDGWWHQEAANQEPYFDRHADVPMVLMCGWYDNFVGATADYYVRMSQQNRSETKLILGPWTHGGSRGSDSSQGDCDTGGASVWSNAAYNPARLTFFDHHLKGIGDDEGEDAPVRVFVMGTGDGGKTRDGKLNHGGYWRNEPEWPIARATPTTFYLDSFGALSATPPNVERVPLAYNFDPHHPVPTIGGPLVGMVEFIRDESVEIPEFLDQWSLVSKNRGEVVPAGGFHQEEQPEFVGAQEPYPLLRDRLDVLTFETDPLNADTEVTGWVEVVLAVSSDAPDTDFTAKLVDVYPPNDDYPDGYHLNLTDTILRMRYRDGWDREVMMNRGEVYEVTLRLWPTSNLFKKGHRIRVDVSSSNFPRFDVNPNTGEPNGKHTEMVAAENTVWVGTEGSRVMLPIVPSNDPNRQ